MVLNSGWYNQQTTGGLLIIPPQSQKLFGELVSI